MRLATEPPMHGADNPLALSLNENPFSPLPAVHAAIVAAVVLRTATPSFFPNDYAASLLGTWGSTAGRSSSAPVLPASSCRYCTR